MKSIATLSVIALTMTLVVQSAVAKPEFRSRIPNGANVPGVQAVGHKDAQGGSGSLNAFGNAFDKADKKWTASLCQADSDGDGQTNGQELGDPCCEWTSSGSPRRLVGLSDPGVASSKSDPSHWETINCTTATPISAATASTSAWTLPLALLSGLVAGAFAAA